MSGTGRDYEALNQTHRAVEGQREASPHHNYEALRETQRQVDARPGPTPAPQQQEPRDPYERAEELKAARARELDALVKDGKITPGEKIYRENSFDNKLLSEMNAHDQRLERARELKAAVNAHDAKEQQKEAQAGREQDGRER